MKISHFGINADAEERTMSHHSPEPGRAVLPAALTDFQSIDPDIHIPPRTKRASGWLARLLHRTSQPAGRLTRERNIHVMES
ncbi:hypothetical protein [Agromyces sp. NPDC058110]|uniref:hypothetical protein n=1 Tax=Agromyces sp. NPDC058110 TaxID=3346345 RepID=UPI0036D77DA2